ncbi:MAG: HAD family hydrolase [Chloroflexi bacterium]|nr:HAD family hydrolase [Chloroflexota bacterium]MBM3154102.1 HAD family hydrolase [Chloroflexota bacterium]MBM3172384.1 HAD family hydrolase [Chloroflexota bacterium]MBM3174810.1 HAD family hydrolase [Chloroflexota bacterium]MBM4449980.1 HAD family hydrolase [Chloroflexota bacterium]
MKLVIFDMDQTLVDFMPFHLQTTRQLFKKFFKVDASLEEVDFSGRSMAENFIALARLKNIPNEEVQKNAGKLLKTYEMLFGQNIPRNGASHVLPGVKELLEELVRTDHIVVLYTGDSPSVVKHVLESTGLADYFEFCVYGTQARTRLDMVKMAIRKAAEMNGVKFRGKDVVIIGDSVRDIDCGKEIDALTIAVATGPHSPQELAEHRPDFLFQNMADYKKVLAAIG